MKKIILILGALAIITSCSKSEDSLPIVPQLPVKEIVLLKSFTKNGLESYFTYSGNKLNDIVTGSQREAFTYTGNLITKIENSVNGVISSSTDYNYINGILSTSILDREVDSYKIKTSYTYGAQALFTVFYVNKITGVETTKSFGSVDCFNYEEENIYGEFSESTYNPGLGVVKRDKDYEFDIYLNPYKNILGFDKLYFRDSERYSKQLIIKTTDRTFYSGYDNTSIFYSNYIVIGNGNVYPKQRVDKDEDGNIINTIKYIYY